MLRYQSLPQSLIAQLIVIAERADTFSAICDACALGIIHGKREVRRKKKRR